MTDKTDNVVDLPTAKRTEGKGNLVPLDVTMSDLTTAALQSAVDKALISCRAAQFAGSSMNAEGHIRDLAQRMGYVRGLLEMAQIIGPPLVQQLLDGLAAAPPAAPAPTSSGSPANA